MKIVAAEVWTVMPEICVVFIGVCTVFTDFCKVVCIFGYESVHSDDRCTVPTKMCAVAIEECIAAVAVLVQCPPYIQSIPACLPY